MHMPGSLGMYMTFIARSQLGRLSFWDKSRPNARDGYDVLKKDHVRKFGGDEIILLMPH